MGSVIQNPDGTWNIITDPEPHGPVATYAEVKTELYHRGADILRTYGVRNILNSCADAMANRASAIDGAYYDYDTAKPSKSKRRLPHAIVYTGSYWACEQNARHNTLLKAVR